VIFFKINVFFRNTARELKRIDSLTRSPIFGGFEEAVQGMVTIRAFGMRPFFEQLNDRRVDQNSKAFIPMWVCMRWLAVRLDILSLVIMLIVSLLAVAFKVC
jgi:ATP-binding cassette subfamily C (CFTR/MRP) protein 1